MDDAIKTPGEFIRDELDARGWTQAELANVMGRPIQAVNEILQGKKNITPETAAALGAAFGNGAEVWMNREAAFRLRNAGVNTEVIERRARLFELAPIKDIQKRGWIRNTNDATEIETDLLRFFELKSIDDEPHLSALMRKTDPFTELLRPQKAWCFRVRQLAKCVAVSPFDGERLAQCERDLRKLAAYSKEARKVPGVLAKYGIRFVIVEPLPGTKLDGMATWLDAESPVIGMSLRFDRIDNFWHTLCHEVKHIVHRDALSVDDSDPANISMTVKPEIERRADAGAAAMLIDPQELKSFILRVGPLYSQERINQFANRIKIHPGVIVGQLQHCSEIGYSANRGMLAKVRDAVISAALTDGWGHLIDERTLL